MQVGSMTAREIEGRADERVFHRVRERSGDFLPRCGRSAACDPLPVKGADTIPNGALKAFAALGQLNLAVLRIRWHRVNDGVGELGIGGPLGTQLLCGSLCAFAIRIRQAGRDHQRRSPA
jgi:hypothetical protein